MPPADGLARFDHVSLAVKDIRKAQEFFHALFSGDRWAASRIPRSEGFILGNLNIEGFKLEFIQSPGTGGKADFVGNFIEKYGEGMHHMTINLKEFDQTLAKLKADGIRVVDEGKDWRGDREFYISPRSAFGALIQVWDTHLNSAADRTMLKAVFFDAAGTLFEAREPVGHTYARIARKHGLTPTMPRSAQDFAAHSPRRRGSRSGRAAAPMRSAASSANGGMALVRRSFEGLGEFDSFDAFFEELFAYFGDPAQLGAVARSAFGLATAERQRNLRLGIISNFDCAALSHSRRARSEADFSRP